MKLEVRVQVSSYFKKIFQVFSSSTRKVFETSSIFVPSNFEFVALTTWDVLILHPLPLVLSPTALERHNGLKFALMSHWIRVHRIISQWEFTQCNIQLCEVWKKSSNIHLMWIYSTSAYYWLREWTTDTRWGNRPHCTTKNQIPIPNL